MKSFLLSTSLFSSLIVALPTLRASRAAPTEANIQLRSGDGDSTFGFAISVGQLVPQINRSGVAASVVEDSIFCQAFSDSEGLTKLGSVFTNLVSASFTSKSDGSVASSLSDAVPIGAFCCVTSADGFGACGGSATTTSASSTWMTTTTSAGSTWMTTTTPASCTWMTTATSASSTWMTSTTSTSSSASSTWTSSSTSTSTSSTAAATADIILKTGDGDASIGFAIPVGTLVSSDRSGVVASVVESDIFCQAFSDSNGAKKLGSIFTNRIDASFTDKSDGSVDSNVGDAVLIGSLCCVTSANGFGACVGDSTATSTGFTSTWIAASTATSTSSSAASTTTAASGSEGNTVRVQLNGLDESAAQGEVPADDSVFVLADHPPFFSDVISAFIVDGEGHDGPTCQAFADVEGNIGVGGSPMGIGAIITTDEIALNGNSGKTVTILSLKCKHG